MRPLIPAVLLALPVVGIALWQLSIRHAEARGRAHAKGMMESVFGTPEEQRRESIETFRGTIAEFQASLAEEPAGSPTAQTLQEEIQKLQAHLHALENPAE